MTRSRRKRSAAANEMSFDERVAEAAKQPTFAKSNALFVHPVRTNRTQRMIGNFPSQTMQTMFPFHSELERVLLNVLDLTIGVEPFFPQSETFWFSHGIRERRYTPDCGAVALNTRIMIETKPEDLAFEPENVEVRELAAPFLRDAGWELLLLTETVLFHPDLLCNLRTIRRRRAHPYREMAIRKIHQALETNGAMSFADCAAISLSMGADADLLYAAIGRRDLYCNLWEPLTDKSSLIHPARAPRPFLLELLGEN